MTLMVVTVTFVSVFVMAMMLISMMVIPTIRHIGEWWWQGVFKPSGKTWRILKKDVVSRIMLAYNHWLLVCWSHFILIENIYGYDCCDDGDVENQHILFNIELIATVSYDYVDWMTMSKMNPPCPIARWLPQAEATFVQAQRIHLNFKYQSQSIHNTNWQRISLKTISK